MLKGLCCFDHAKQHVNGVGHRLREIPGLGLPSLGQNFCRTHNGTPQLVLLAKLGKLNPEAVDLEPYDRYLDRGVVIVAAQD